MLTIVLVSVGIFQTYIVDNIAQLLQLGFKSIHIITEKKYFTKIPKHDAIRLIDAAKIDINYFDANSKLNKTFRNGFWNNTSKRFFLIYEYMKNNNIKNVLHLENDVLLYNNMKKIAATAFVRDDEIYITMDSNYRCIPGIIYIPKYDLLTNLIKNYDFTENDMVNLAKFYHKEKHIVKTFPIIDNSIRKCVYNENYYKFNSIFDGAAIGQYLGGVDPRNKSGDTTGFINTTCEIKYNKYDFKWIRKGNNVYPHIKINNMLIPINNLHIHSKNLAQFRINNPIENKYIQHESTKFITGEKIQFLCDHFIGTKKDFNYNPNVANYKNRYIKIGYNVAINNKKLIFCYTHLLDNIELLITTLKMMKNPFKLIFHNSDNAFNKNHLILFNKLPLLIHIYTQNCNIIENRVSYLPIGLGNSQWPHGSSSIHREVYNKNIEKTKEIYFNFNIKTNKNKRQKCFNIIEEKGIYWNDNLPYKKYLLELKKHKYAICPEGNGIDTHRFWECLYMNTIPICVKNKLTEYYKQYFPIIVLNDWEELNITQLDYSKKINHKMLDIKYIKQLLENDKEWLF